jgi:hypothetical protein
MSEVSENPTININERNIDLLSGLKTSFEEIVKDYIANRVYSHQFKANLSKLKELDKSLEFLSHAQLNVNIYNKFSGNFKDYMHARIYSHQFHANIETLKVALSNSRTQNILENNMLEIENRIDFKTNKECYDSLRNLLQTSFDRNESDLINGRIYQHQYKARLDQLTDIENTINDVQKNYQWHIAKYYKEMNLSIEKNENKQPVLVTTKIEIPPNVSLNAKPQHEEKNEKTLSWFKLLCLKIFPFLFKSSTPNNDESKEKATNNELDFNDVVQKAWSQIDYNSVNETCKAKMEHIKSVIDDIDLKGNSNLAITLEVKNTVLNVLPKLIAIFNSVKDKNSLNEEKENAHMILENSLVAISTYFDTLKEEQIQNDVEDIKVYGEFVKTKYLKAKAGM